MRNTAVRENKDSRIQFIILRQLWWGEESAKISMLKKVGSKFREFSDKEARKQIVPKMLETVIIEKLNRIKIKQNKKCFLFDQEDLPFVTFKKIASEKRRQEGRIQNEKILGQG